MGLVREETKHETLPAELMVVEREKRECREPWRFVELRVDDFHKLTPRELRDLGRWLQQQGRRLGREYKSNGAPRLCCWRANVTVQKRWPHLLTLRVTLDTVHPSQQSCCSP